MGEAGQVTTIRLVKLVLTVGLTLLVLVSGVAFVLSTKFALAITSCALLLAVALDHAVRFLTRHRFSRKAAQGLVVSGLVLTLVGGGVVLIPPGVRQARTLVEELPSYINRIKKLPLYRSLNQRFGVDRHLSARASRQAQDSVAGPVAAATPVVAAVGGALTTVVGLLSVVFLAIFMLLFGGRLVQATLREVRPDNRARLERVLAQIYGAIGGYLAGLGFICGVNAALTTACLAILRVPYFLPLGVVAGCSSLVPYVGPALTLAGLPLVVLFTKGGWQAAACFLYLVFYWQLEGNVLSPMVFKRTVDVNPLVTLLAVLFMGELMGVLGALVAVPVAAAGQIVLGEVLALRRARQEAALLAAQAAPEVPLVAPTGLPPEQPGEPPLAH